MGSMTSIEEVAAAWIAKRDSGHWTEADEQEFSQWLDASTGHRVAYLRLNAAWERADRLKALGAGVAPGVVPDPGEWGSAPFFDQRPPGARPDSGTVAPHVRRFHHHPNRAVAASFVFSLIVGAAWYLWPTGPTYHTPVGGLAAVPMADGSSVTLNTDTEIQLAVTASERRVELKQGEAFFEVAKDPQRPFVVRVRDTRVIAVGTKFSVRRESDEVQVVVTEGRVRLEPATAGLTSTPVPPAEVSAGGIARSRADGVMIQERALTDVEEILSWRSGYLVFKDAPLADAVAEFNRYNTRKIVIEDAAVAGIRIGGNFRSTNVDAFVRLLQDGFPIRVEQNGDEIVLTSG